MTEQEENTERLEKVIEQLRGRCQHLTDQLTAVQGEGQAVQEERDRLIQRNSRVVEDLHERENFWKERLKQNFQISSLYFKQMSSFVS